MAPTDRNDSNVILATDYNAEDKAKAKAKAPLIIEGVLSDEILDSLGLINDYRISVGYYRQEGALSFKDEVLFRDPFELPLALVIEQIADKAGVEDFQATVKGNGKEISYTITEQKIVMASTQAKEVLSPFYTVYAACCWEDYTWSPYPAVYVSTCVVDAQCEAKAYITKRSLAEELNHVFIVEFDDVAYFYNKEKQQILPMEKS